MAELGHHENVKIDWDSIKWDELTEAEKWNYEHMRMHQKHAGLAKAEMDMMTWKTWILVCIASQICLTLWKKWRAWSYHLATLIGKFTKSPASPTFHFFHFSYVDHSAW